MHFLLLFIYHILSAQLTPFSDPFCPDFTETVYSNSWNMPDGYGTDNAIYVEDSTFTWTGGAVGDVLDGECGARFVIRNNHITNEPFAKLNKVA
jgi:hypothetical protein